MDPLIVLGLALVAAAVAAAVWQWRARASAAGDPPGSREARAEALGWLYDGAPGGDAQFTFKGEESGVKWKLSYRSGDAAAGERPTLTWATRSVQGTATELRLIGRARYERGKANMEPIRERLSSLILSAREIADAQERAGFIERTTPANVGSERFRRAFTVIARNQRLARALLDTATESLIAEWPGADRIRSGRIGLRVDRLERPAHRRGGGRCIDGDHRAPGPRRRRAGEPLPAPRHHAGRDRLPHHPAGAQPGLIHGAGRPPAAP